MVEHVNIVDGQRHEPKGASTAVNNQVAHSNGDGTTTFKFIDYANVVNKPLPFVNTPVLSTSSLSSQAPAAVDTPLQVNFGSPQSNTNVSLAANGTLTFNTAGTYAITLFLRYGRSTAAGVSTIISRFLIDDVQVLNSNGVAMSDINAIVPFSATFLFNVTAGTTFKLQIMRDSTGTNNGGLVSFIPTLPGWNPVASATLVVNKVTG